MPALKGDVAHPSPLDLIALVRGKLRRGAATRVRQHCAVCDDCSAQLQVVHLLRHAAGLSCATDSSHMLGPSGAEALVH